MSIAYCGGTFDLFHPGHVRFFKWCWQTFDKVVVALNRDEFVLRYKGVLPTQSLAERMEMVLSCRYVDNVVINRGDEDSTITIKEVNPTHVVNGSDWTEEKLKTQMGLSDEFLKDHKIVIALCPLVRNLSTTELRNRILNGN